MLKRLLMFTFILFISSVATANSESVLSENLLYIQANPSLKEINENRLIKPFNGDGNALDYGVADNVHSIGFIVTANATGVNRDEEPKGAVGLVAHFGLDYIKNGSFHAEDAAGDYTAKYNFRNLHHGGMPYNVFNTLVCNAACKTAMVGAGEDNFYEPIGDQNSFPENLYSLIPSPFIIATQRNKDIEEDKLENAQTYFPNAALDIYVPITNTTRTDTSEARYNNAYFYTHCYRSAIGDPIVVDKNDNTLARDTLLNVNEWTRETIVLEDYFDEATNGNCDYTDINENDKAHQYLIGDEFSESARKLIGWGVPVISFHESPNIWAPGFSYGSSPTYDDPSKARFTIAAKFVQTGNFFDDDATLLGSDTGNVMGGFGAYKRFGTSSTDTTGSLASNQIPVLGSSNINNAYLGFFTHENNLSTHSPSMVLRDKSALSENMFIEAPMTNVGIGVHYNDITNTPKDEPVDYDTGDPVFSVVQSISSTHIPIQHQINSFLTYACKQGLMNVIASTTERLYPPHLWNMTWLFQDWNDLQDATPNVFGRGCIRSQYLIPSRAFGLNYEDLPAAPTGAAINTNDDSNHVKFAPQITTKENFATGIAGQSLADHLPWATLEVWGGVKVDGLSGSSELKELEKGNAAYKANELGSEYTLTEIKVKENIVRGPIFSNFVAVASSFNGDGVGHGSNELFRYISSDINMFKIMILRTLDISWRDQLHVNDFDANNVPDIGNDGNRFDTEYADYLSDVLIAGTVNNVAYNNEMWIKATTSRLDSLVNSTSAFAFRDATASNDQLDSNFSETEDVYARPGGAHPIITRKNSGAVNKNAESPLGRIELGPYNFPFIEFYWEDHEDASKPSGHGYFNIETGFLPDEGNVSQAITKFHLRYKVDDDTHLAEGSEKSFVIDHPTDKDKYLVHYMIEAPEARVFYRGNAKLKDGKAEITLPDYFEALTMKKGRNIQLSALDRFEAVTVKLQDGVKIKDGKFTIISENQNSDATVSWEVLAIRGDIPEINVEPKKDALDVKRIGPYTYGVPK